MLGFFCFLQGPRVGVELDNAVGKNNGTINSHTYFNCRDEHGVLVVPAKIAIPTKAPVLARRASQPCVGGGNDRGGVSGGGEDEKETGVAAAPAALGGARGSSGPLSIDAMRRSISSLLEDLDYVEVSAPTSALWDYDIECNKAASISSFESLSSLRSIGVSV